MGHDHRLDYKEEPAAIYISTTTEYLWSGRGVQELEKKYNRGLLWVSYIFWTKQDLKFLGDDIPGMINF